MPRAPGSAALRRSRDWPPATPPASVHGAAADTPAPSTPVAERRHADRDGTTSGSSSTVDDEARRACLALVCLGHRVPIGPRGLRLLTAPTSPSQLLPPGAPAAHATKWSTSREQRRVISRERRRLDEAEAAARAVLVRYPDVVDGLERLGMVYEARGDRQQAANYYRQAVGFILAHPEGFDGEIPTALAALANELDPLLP